VKPYQLIRPALFALDPETAHHSAFLLGSLASKVNPLLGITRSLYHKPYPELEQRLFGLSFRSPLGIAAGFDKNGLIVPLLDALGFGFIEVGSVSAKPCAGNPKPRLFRLPEDEALINRMGLNNDGARKIVARLRDYSLSSDFVLAVNVVKTNDNPLVEEKAIDDFVTGVKQAAQIARLIVLNISCPNTDDGKTFEEPASLKALLEALHAIAEPQLPPLLLKCSSDATLSALGETLQLATSFNIAGLVLSNTSNTRERLKTNTRKLESIGRGGLSGPPIFERSLERVRFCYRETKGTLPIIGVGGIHSAESAWEYICAGASLVELYTGLIYEGPGIAKRINSGLIRLIKEAGFTSISQAVGSRNEG